MPQVGLQPMIPLFVRAKTVYALGRATTMIGMYKITISKYVIH
jgi:hypothetical protein